MTADDGGRGVFAEDDVIFYNHLILNLDKGESEIQKYINHKFS